MVPLELRGDKHVEPKAMDYCRRGLPTARTLTARIVGRRQQRVAMARSFHYLRRDLVCR